MSSFPAIPAGYGYPLVTMDDGRLPQDTMDAIAESTELSNTIAAAMQTLEEAQAAPNVAAGRIPAPLASPLPTCVVQRAWGLSVSASIVAGGSDYAVNDTITLAGGTTTTPAIVRVASVSSGAVSSVTVVRPGVYSASPAGTFTQASTSGAGTGFQMTGNWTGNPTGLNSADINNFAATNPLFRFWGNGPTNVASSGGYGNTVGNGTMTTWEWDSNAAYLEVRMLAFSTYGALYIDDRRVMEGHFATDGSAANVLYQVTHATAVKRRYKLMLSSGLFVGVRVSTASTATVTAPAASRPLVWGLGDSYMFGSGANDVTLSSFGVMCQELGIDGLADGVGGSGWTGGTAGTAADRIAAKLVPLTRDPDYIVWDIGYNNFASSLSAVTAAMESAIVAAKAAVPTAKHFAFSPATPLGETPQLLALKNAMAAKFAEHDIPMIDQANWVNASNKAIYTGADDTHPTPAGHAYLGARKAAALRPMLVL